MKYRELWLPFLIFFALAPIIVSVKPESEITQFILSLLSVGILVYYLRWKNTGTPLINILTVFIVILYEGVFIIEKFPQIGRLSVLIGGLGFGLGYFIRIKMKADEDKKGRYTLLKVVCVLFYLLGEFIYAMNYPKYSEATVIGGLILAFAYFYDRLNNYDEILEKHRNP